MHSTIWPMVCEAWRSTTAALLALALTVGVAVAAPSRTPSVATSPAIPRVYLVDGAAQTVAITLWFAGKDIRTLW